MFGIFLFPDYYYKFSPIENKQYDSILGPFRNGSDTFILFFNRAQGELNEIASSLSKKDVYGEALITKFKGSCQPKDIIIIQKIVYEASTHAY